MVSGADYGASATGKRRVGVFEHSGGYAAGECWRFLVREEREREGKVSRFSDILRSQIRRPGDTIAEG